MIGDEDSVAAVLNRLRRLEQRIGHARRLIYDHHAVDSQPTDRRVRPRA